MSLGNILYTIILRPLVQIIEIVFFLTNKLFDNTGIAILCVSFAVTLLCLPLYIVAEHWQQVERDTQSKLKGGIDRIKSVFKGDEQYMILTTFYKQNHYHPIMALRSSFGLLIQIPFFMAAYSCLSNLPALHGESFLFIKDMGSPDAIFYLGKLPVNILPIAMTIINIIAGAIYTKGFPFKEKAQIYGMALIFLVILYDSPSGLVLYWTMNNVLSLVKNIFYKLKNPLKVFYFCICGAVIFVAVFILFVYSGGASYKKRLATAVPMLLLIGIPLYLKFINWLLNTPLSGLLNNSKKRFSLYILSAISLTLLSGLVLPSSLIASSVQEFSNVGSYTVPTAFITSPFWQNFGILIFWTMCIYFLFHEKIQTIISVLFSTLLVSAIANVYLFSGNYGSMDITLKFIGGIQSQTKLFLLSNVLVNIIILIIPIIIISLKKEKILTYITLISAISFLFLGTINIFKIKSEYKQFTQAHTIDEADLSNSTKFSLSKTGKNVVIFMLDRAENSYVDYIFKDNPELNSIFSGFTYYPNTVSFNSHTLMGSPSVYGGYEYTPQGINSRPDKLLSEKHNEATLVLSRILTENAGFTSQMYDTSWGNFSYEADMHFTDGYEKISGGILRGRYTGDFKKNLESYDSNFIKNSVERNLFFVSLFRTSPAVLRPAVYYKGSWWASEEVNDLDSFIDWFGSLYYMDDLTDFNNPNNSLLIITNEATHTNCNISELNLINHDISFKDANNYLSNTACIEAIGKWINLLKENGVYDNTRIIIVADHGVGYGPTAFEKYNDPFIDDYEKDHFNPIFLVKDFNADGDIKTDMSFMTNADTPILAVKGLVDSPVNPFTGNRIDEFDKSEGVLITIDGIFMPHHTKSNKIFTVADDTWFKVKDNIFIDENWEAVK